MLLYFYGSDTYRLRRAVLKVSGEYAKKYGTAPERFEMDTEDAVARLDEFCAGRSLFVTKKCAIVDVSVDQPKELKKILKEIGESKDVTLIIESDHKLPKEFDAALKGATAKEFEPLTDAKLLSFIKEETGALGLSVSDGAIRAVCGAYGGDTWAIMTELQAISCGKQFEAPHTAPAFFPLIQGLKGTGVVGRQLGALHQLFEHYEAAYGFNVISSMADAATKVAMADYDVMIKSGKLDYPEALLDLVLARS